MCGRYRLSRRKQLVAEYFDAVPGDDEWNPRYNIAPTQPVPIIRQHPKEPRRELSLVRWGLIPSWAKDTSGSDQMINARSETAATKPAFRDPIKFRRCLVPADRFYECLRTGKAKDPSGQWIKSCSMLTTTPNAVTSAVHDRMPVILGRADYDLWLDPGMRNVDAVSELLKPYDARAMRSYPVSNRVNHVAHDDAECTKPIELEAPPQAQLFA
jgi:putative SOS response-associated peptidase YedK